MVLNLLNTIKKMLSYRTSSREISYKEVLRIMQDNPEAVLIDVRSAQEYKEGHLENSISIPVYDLAKNIVTKINKRDSIIILYCQTGKRSKKAAKILGDLCYTNVYTIKDGLGRLSIFL